MKFEDTFTVVGCPLPTSFRADARTVGSLESWQAKNVVTYYPASDAPEIGYDKIVKLAKAVEPRPTHILFVDYDVLTGPDTLKKLIEHDKDIVCGVYPASQKGSLKWCLSSSRDEEKFSLMDIDELPDEMFKTQVGANGMMLVKMEVFDKLEWPYWKTEYHEDGAKLGADIYFFDKAREAGYDIWVDPSIKCSHFKTVDLLGFVQKYAVK